MSLVDDLLKKSRRYAEQAQEAEAALAAERVTRTARNDERRAEFWADAADRCTKALHAARDARSAVVDLVAIGDLTGALQAYSEYMRLHTEATVVVSLAKSATRHYVYDEVRQKDPNDRARKIGTGYHVPAMERITVRVLASRYDAEHGGPPQGTYAMDYAEGVPSGIGDQLVAFAALMEQGSETAVARIRSEFAAELLAPLTAVLEPED